MSTLAATFVTLADKLKSQDPDGKIATVIEMLRETNPILEDALAMEANGKTVHRTTVRTGIPSGTWRKFYGGIQPTKTTKKQVDEIMGMLEDMSQVDRDLAQLGGNEGAFRLSESEGHMMGLNNQMATALFYSNADSTPEQFHGLAPRYNSIELTDKTKSGYNIVDAGGTGSDNSSMWLITWGDNAAHTIYPTGSTAGLRHEDRGEEMIQESDGSKWIALVDWYKWDIGLVVRDHRACARIANIDVSDMRAGNVALEDFMITAYYRVLRAQAQGQKVFYVNFDVAEALHKRAKDQNNVQLSLDTFEGKEIVRFLGIPVKTVEALLNNEARVV